MLGFIDGVEEKELRSPLSSLKKRSLKRLEKNELPRNICLGDYQEWDPIRQIKILEKRLGMDCNRSGRLASFCRREKLSVIAEYKERLLKIAFLKRGILK